MCVLLTQSCLTLCNPMDYSLADSSIHRITRLEYWNEQLIPSPGYIPDPGIEPASPALKADSLLSVPPGKPLFMHKIQFICEMTQVHVSLVIFSASLLQGPLFFLVGIILPTPAWSFPTQSNPRNGM